MQYKKNLTRGFNAEKLLQLGQCVAILFFGAHFLTVSYAAYFRSMFGRGFRNKLQNFQLSIYLN